MHSNPSSAAFLQKRFTHYSDVKAHKWPVTRKMFPFDDVIMIHIPYHKHHPAVWYSLIKADNFLCYVFSCRVKQKSANTSDQTQFLLLSQACNLTGNVSRWLRLTSHNQKQVHSNRFDCWLLWRATHKLCLVNVVYPIFGEVIQRDYDGIMRKNYFTGPYFILAVSSVKLALDS